MVELLEKLDKLRLTLDKDQQKLFSLHSIKNFLLYYPHLKNYQQEVKYLLIEYFELMEAADYYIEKEMSQKIGIDYIMKLGYYYTAFLGFKMKMKLDFAIFWGFLVDVLLLISGVLKAVHYLPVSTFLLILYWGYIKVVKERKNKVFAIGY